jgi:hypothetical protein
MTAQKTGGVVRAQPLGCGVIQWRHTSVLIRADIFAAAHERGLNFSHECNRALADLVDIDYDQQQLPEETPAEPVLVAPEQEGPSHAPPDSGTGRTPLPPVINADDPATPIHVLKLKKERTSGHARKEPAATPRSVHADPEVHAPQFPETSALRRTRETTKKPAPDKKKRESAIKRFVTTKLARGEGSDDGENVIAKDEMYQLFVRWCRIHSISGIPDKRSFGVALKNRFVMQEAAVKGSPCWINVKIR